jgi:hypothetical protein
MNRNLECPTCPIGDNPALCFFASRVEKVYVSDGIATSPYENMVVAEDEIRRGQVTPEDISHLKPKIEEDIQLSLTGCFIPLHEQARQDSNTLTTLVDEQRIAVAGCATHRLQGTCEL